MNFSQFFHAEPPPTGGVQMFHFNDKVMTGMELLQELAGVTKAYEAAQEDAYAARGRVYTLRMLMRDLERQLVEATRAVRSLTANLNGCTADNEELRATVARLRGELDEAVHRANLANHRELLSRDKANTLDAITRATDRFRAPPSAPAPPLPDLEF